MNEHYKRCFEGAKMRNLADTMLMNISNIPGYETMRSEFDSKGLDEKAKNKIIKSVQIEDHNGDSVSIDLKIFQFSSPSEEAQNIHKEAKKLERGRKKLEDEIEYQELLRGVLEKSIDNFNQLGFTTAEQWRVYFKKELVRQTKEQIELLKEIRNIKIDSEPSNEENLVEDSGKIKPHKIYRRFMSPDLFEVLVGRSSTANDVLTMKLSDSTDLFFHVAKHPGSHVIVKTKKLKLSEIPKSTMVYAANLAVKYSSVKVPQKLGVTFALRKNLNKISGMKAGSVIVRKSEGVLKGHASDAKLYEEI